MFVVLYWVLNQFSFPQWILHKMKFMGPKLLVCCARVARNIVEMLLTETWIPNKIMENKEGSWDLHALYIFLSFLNSWTKWPIFFECCRCHDDFDSKIALDVLGTCWCRLYFSRATGERETRLVFYWRYSSCTKVWLVWSIWQCTKYWPSVWKSVEKGPYLWLSRKS